jgi:hypothetical protein
MAARKNRRTRRPRKARRLLLEHLERVSPRVLEEYPDAMRELIRRRSGVYALYRKNKLYYVGLASNLMGRIKQHLRDRHHGGWDRFSVYLTARAEHMRELESLLLRIMDPAGNKVRGRLAAAENLIPRLEDAMRKRDADRRATILGGRSLRKRRRQKSSQAKGTRVLAGLVEHRRSLQGNRSGKVYRAALRRDGRISYRRKLYETPTGAARAALGVQRNGWGFWHFKNERGRWVPLRTLKR